LKERGGLTMHFSKINLFSILFMSAAIMFSCSEGEIINNDTLVQSISVTTEKESYYLGTNIRININFNGFNSNPTEIDVIITNGHKQYGKTLTVHEESYISIPTDTYVTGNCTIYLKSGNTSSNTITIKLIERPHIYISHNQDEADSNGYQGIGNTIIFNYSIYGSTFLPSTIALFCEEKPEPIKVFDSTSSNSILSFSTDEFTEGDYSFYIKYENQESNRIKLKFIEKKISIKLADNNETEGDCILHRLIDGYDIWDGGIGIIISLDGIKKTENKPISYYLTKDNEEPESGECFINSYNGSYTSSISFMYKTSVNDTYTYYLQYGTIKSNTITIHTKKQIDIILYFCNGNSKEYDSTSNTTFKLPEKEKLGFTLKNADFLGWTDNLDSYEVVYDDGQMITPRDDLNLYAVWKILPPKNISINSGSEWIYNPHNSDLDFKSDILNYINITSDIDSDEQVDYFFNTINDTSSAEITTGEQLYSLGLQFYLPETKNYYFWGKRTVRLQVGYNSNITLESNFSDVIEYNNTYKQLQPPQILNQMKIDDEDVVYRYLTFTRTGAKGYHIYASDTNNTNTAKLFFIIKENIINTSYIWIDYTGKQQISSGNSLNFNEEISSLQDKTSLTVFVGKEDSASGTDNEKYSPLSHKYKYYWVKSAEIENFIDPERTYLGISKYSVESDFSESYEWNDN
jgi:hypothetical protein